MDDLIHTVDTTNNPSTHASPCDRLHDVEGRVQSISNALVQLSTRVDNMKETVQRNQEEFKGRISGLEGNQQTFMVQLVQHRSEYRTGTALLAFLITAGIALIGVLGQ